MEESQIKQIIEQQPLHGSALLDPRCKILLLVCIGFVSYFLAGEVVSLALMLVYGLFIAVGNGGKWALKMIAVYIIVAYLNALLRYVQVPVLSVIMSVFGVTLLKLIPIVMMGLWILRTTYMDDLMVALQRMRLPQAVTIPLVVMFRYIPTLRIEYRQIRSTMDIRGISDTLWKRVSHPLATIEYILIPLLMRCLKVTDELAASGVVLKKGVNPSTDLEPEYIAVSGGKAYITLQENNAIAALDLTSRTFDGIYSAGFEDYSVTPIDIDKKDDAYAPRTYGSLMGIRMPDAIAAFQVDGKTYLVTANEGDAREWGDEDLGTFYLSEDEQDFGEEGVTSPTGAITGENSGLEGKVVFFKVEDFDGLDTGKDYLFGGRTFTVYEAGEAGLTEVFTSGDDFEALTAQYLPDYYNCSNDNTVVDDRSGKKGPEAESVTVGTVDGRTYAFVALERTGGVMVYDVTEPASAQYVNYINTRDFSSTVEGSEEYEDGELDKWVTGGDVAPEGLLFLSDAVSPTGEALLLAACEVSGTVAVYQVGGEPLSVLPFTDVEARDAQAVRYVCENGLMAGVSADRFEPNGTLTRGEAVTALWALEGRPVVNDLMDFSDVDPAASYGEAVRWAASEGIAGGYGGGLFGPDDPITREQLAVMLYRYARHEGYDTAQGGMADREFADYDQIAGYAAEAMTWAVEAGVLTATSLDTLAPGQAATRVQTAQALLALSQFTK